MESSLKAEIQKQVEYYLSDLNLKQDEFFHNIISKNDEHTIPIESLLNCNKIKKLNATQDSIIEAIKDSQQIEVGSDGSSVKRKGDRPLPTLEPKVSKKVKGENGSTKVHQTSNNQEETKAFEPKIFKVTLSKADENVKWDKIQTEIQNATGVKIGYTRLHDVEGHIAVDENTLTEEVKNKILTTPIKIGEIDVKVEDCLGQDLTKFYGDHGGHLDMCLERSGLKKKSKFGKKDRKDRKDKPEQRRDDIDFVFFNKRYHSLTPLKHVFKSIIQKTDDDEPIKEGDHQLLMELLKYHESYDEKSKDIKHFTVGQHPLYKQTRCFFVVRNDGTKEDFSSTKCLENIKAKFNVSE